MFTGALLTIVDGHDHGHKASDFKFNYVDFDKWGDLCVKGAVEGEVQQTPIDLLSDAPRGGTVDLKFTDIKTDPAMSLTQSLDIDTVGGGSNLAMMLLSNQTDPLSVFEFNGISYKLASMHSHWGSSEHLLDGQGADGCFHFVHASDNGDLGVIEIKVVFVQERGDNVVDEFPRCAKVPRAHIEENFSDLNCVYIPPEEREEPEDAVVTDKSIYGMFGIDIETFSGAVTHYVGSLTTPPCTTGLQWFVIDEPVQIYDPQGDWNGCRSFQSAFPHQIIENTCIPGGNYRSPQYLQASTEYFDVQIGSDSKSTESSALATVALSAIGTLLMAMLF